MAADCHPLAKLHLPQRVQPQVLELRGQPWKYPGSKLMRISHLQQDKELQFDSLPDERASAIQLVFTYSY